MVDLSIYFSPIEIELDDPHNNSLFSIIDKYTENSGFPEWEEANIAIIGVKEERGSRNNEGCANGSDVVREELYQLFEPGPEIKIVDFGNINPGESLQDTYYALSNTVTELIKKKVIPIIIGGSQDLTYANYMAYEKLEQVVNLVAIDSRFDIGKGEKEVYSDSFLSKIVLHQPNFLFNYSNIGYQTYFVSPEEKELMSKLYFDVYRLGEVQEDIKLAEPIVRNADIVSIDVAAARKSECPGTSGSSANGFYGDEMCQLAWYAGISDKTSSFGVYELNPGLDKAGQSAQLVAQMIWCFIDGYLNRKGDFPIANKKSYTKYRVALDGDEHELIFYKSNKSDRWWMDVPYPPNKKIQFERHHLVPCSYTDYQKACDEEMPDKWWKTYQKLI